MTTNELVQKVAERVANDYQELEMEWLSFKPEHLIYRAYEIACIKEIAFFFGDEGQYLYKGRSMQECVFEDNELEAILNCKGNFLAWFYDKWLDYDNEFHNLFYWQDMEDMLHECIYDYFLKERD